MSNQSLLEQFDQLVAESVSSNHFIKISLGNYQGNERDLKNLYVRPIKIKRVDMLSFNYRYKTRDVFKNFPIADGLIRISHFISNDFKVCTLFTTVKEIIIEHDKKGAINLREKIVQGVIQPVPTHDKEKKRIIPATGKTYLTALKVTDEKGVVFKNAQDKFKQINQYINLLDPLIKSLPVSGKKKVVDMGSGKGYLTFALYDYLINNLKIDAAVTGVEYREDMVNLCNRIAADAKFDGLNFIQGSIEEYDSGSIDLLIALHACDTATDDAIYKGIKAGAELIVVAPCCHKQIRREMEKGKKDNELQFLTKYGIFLERQAEMVTDGFRALILEYFGYKTKVFEFISDAHTPKNVLVVGVRSKTSSIDKEEILVKIKQTKEYFGIGHHHLEKLMGI